MKPHKGRKDKITIMSEIVKLTLNKAYNKQQLAFALKSHWLTIRECTDFLVGLQVLDSIETPDGNYVYFWRAK